MSSFSVKIDESLFNSAEMEGKANFRSADNQINFWAKVGKNALENPDLPVDFIAKVIIAKNQPSEKFEFEE
ncbi:MAG: hypothetical protein IK062_06255 [Selenomonadaceae bacterium]|nr:hypothetical protein [Selenomonadaceae bacterium]